MKLNAEMFGADADGRCSNENVMRVLEKEFVEEPPGMIELHDLEESIGKTGFSYILTGEADGENAIVDAINEAIASPTATKILSKALSIFLNIEASADILTLMSVSDTVSAIEEASHPEAEILWDMTFNDELGDRVKVLLIASRLPSDAEESALKKIYTDRAPAAVGPYSQAIEVNGVVFCSGQIAIDPTVGEIVATDIEGQAEQCCRNVEAVLNAAGVEIKNVVKTTCFLADIADFKIFNAIYAKHFVGKPARSCVAVKDLPAGALCEIEVIAVK